MTLYIPWWVFYVLGGIVVWYVLGYTFNNTVMKRQLHKRLRARRTSVVSDRFFLACALICGPVGWVAYVAGLV